MNGTLPVRIRENEVKNKLPLWLQELVYTEEFKTDCDAAFARIDTDGNEVLEDIDFSI